MKKYIKLSTYTDYEKIKSPRSKQEYSYHFTESDIDDSQELFRSFKGQISPIHPYDDAEYIWARFENGTVKYVQNGKVIYKTYYDMPDDDIDMQYEWCSDIVDQIIIHLDKMNINVKPKMVHN